MALGGGVAANGPLRERVAALCEERGLRMKLVATQLCTDNAVMIAFTAMQRLESGEETPLTTEIDPNLALA